MKLIGILKSEDFKQKVLQQRELLKSGRKLVGTVSSSENNQIVNVLTEIKNILTEIKNRWDLYLLKICDRRIFYKKG